MSSSADPAEAAAGVEAYGPTLGHGHAPTGPVVPDYLPAPTTPPDQTDPADAPTAPPARRPTQAPGPAGGPEISATPEPTDVPHAAEAPHTTEVPHTAEVPGHTEASRIAGNNGTAGSAGESESAGPGAAVEPAGTAAPTAGAGAAAIAVRPRRDGEQTAGDESWLAAPLRAGKWSTAANRGGDGQPAGPRRPPRRPGWALATLVVLALVATFFAWVTAEPMWLAVGHGETGTATVQPCEPEPDSPRCVVFTADSGLVVPDVELFAADRGALTEGTSLPARMLSTTATRAYAADPLGLHLRWGVGLLLVLLCGVGIAWATGAARLDDRRSRRWALLSSFAAPLLLMVGFLAAAW